MSSQTCRKCGKDLYLVRHSSWLKDHPRIVACMNEQCDLYKVCVVPNTSEEQNDNAKG